MAKSLSKRLAPVCHADYFQRVAIRPQERRNNRSSLPGLGEREQGMRRAALKQNVELDETASGVEQSPNRVTRSKQQQRIGREMADINQPFRMMAMDWPPSMRVVSIAARPALLDAAVIKTKSPFSMCPSSTTIP